MKTYLQRFFKYVLLGVAVLTILFAVLVSMSRMLIPLVADYREDLEVLATNALGRSVEVGEISAEWPGLWPSIHLTDIKIHSTQTDQVWLQIPAAKISLNPVHYLGKGRIEATRIDLSGLELELERLNKKQLAVNGEIFNLDVSSPDNQQAFLQWVFTRSVIKLHNSQVSYRVPTIKSPLLLKHINLFLENRQNDHHAYGQFVVDGETSSSVSFVLDMKGNMLNPQDVSNRVFLKGDIHMTAALQPWIKPYITIDAGSMMVELWGDGKLHQFEYIKANVQARELNWSLPDRGTEVVSSQIDQLNANVVVARAANGWSADIKNFSLRKNGLSWPRSDIHMLYQFESPEQPASLEVSASYLKLHDLSGLLSENLPVTLPLTKRIRQLSLRGVVRNLNLQLQHRSEKIEDIYLNASFNKLGFDRWEKIPGASNLSGKIVMDETEGSVRLDTESSTLDMGELFKQPVDLNHLAGEIYWQRKAGATSVYLNDVAMSSDIVEANIAGNIQLASADSSPFMDLAVDFRNGHAAAAHTYFPQTVLGHAIRSWLDHAFVSGRVTDGKVILHGLMSDFPFRQGEGTFMVDFNVEDVRLKYKNDWPHVQGIDANVVFKDDSLHIDVNRAEVMKVNIMNSTLDIARLGKGSVIDLDLNMTGRTQRLLNYVYSITTDSTVRDYLSALRATGDMHSHWALTIPLKKPQAFYLKGQTSFDNGSLQLPKWKQAFTRLKGSVDYTFKDQRMSYRSDLIKGEYRGQPASFTINTRNKTASAKTSITMQSRLGLADLVGEYVKEPGSLFSGQSDWKAELVLGEREIGLTLRSDLQGEQIKLPDGFGKVAASTQNLNISAQLGKPGAEFLRINYANRLNALIELSSQTDDFKVERASVVIGSGKAVPAKEKGWWLSGSLQQFTWQAWQKLLPDTYGDSTGLPLQWLNKADLNIGKLLISRHEYNQISLIAIRRTNDIQVTLGSQEVAGKIIIPDNISAARRVRVDLKYLRFRPSTRELEATILDPRVLPPFELHCDNLYLDDQSLGELSLMAEQTTDGLRISELSVESDVLTIVANGNWFFRNSWHESSFNIEMSTPAIANAMSLFDFQTNIDKAAAQATIEASWSGPPHWFEMKRLNGTVNFKVDKGHLQDVSPRGGRIFGLLSIQNLPRRLSLDFSDLFKKGLSFDNIEGQFNISDGNAYTNNLFLDAPSAKIEIKGRIGLATEEYDQEVVVTPKISSSIPVLGLAAGPQVALGLYLTEKVLRKKINELSRITYTVTGPWANPVITRQSNEAK